jgi:hypothetical protein
MCCAPRPAINKDGNDKMFVKTCMAISLVGGLVMGAGAARAQDGDQCVQLFIDRNKIYADAHYCFKTKEALAYFSNKGCIQGEPRLTASQQRRVAEIQRAERQNNCRTR